MTNKMMTTTAFALLLSTAAFAQTTEGDATTGGPIFSTETPSVVEDIEGFFETNEHWILATSLIGETVYTGTTDEDETVGDIRDIVMGQDGTAEAVVIGVGGFLGIGEKEVAVDFDLISRTMDADGDVWIVVGATRDQIEAAPEFDRDAIRAEEDRAAETETPAADGAAVPVETADEGGEVVPLDTAAVSADRITGLGVYGADEQSIGTVSDVLLNADGQADAVVVDVGGFLGVGAKPVAIGLEGLELVVSDEEWESIRTTFTREQLEAHAEYSEQAYQDGDEAIVLRATAD